MANTFRRVVAVLCCAALAAGCSGIPSSGPARVVRRVQAEGPEPPEPQIRRVIPPNPPPDARPDEVVRVFLAAQAEPQGGYAVARRYLAPDAEWDPNGRVVVYSGRRPSPAVVRGDRARVQVAFDTTGAISRTGEFRPRAGTMTVTFRLQRLGDDIGWRVTSVPAGVLLPRDEVASSFQRATVYWTDQARRLVPDLVFLPASEQPVAGVVRALLGGPQGWLRPSVRTAIPAGTELLRPPEVVDGVVTLTFSREVRGAPRESLATLVAQVVWTLTERPEVQAVRLNAEDEAIAVPGRPGLRDHRRSDWLDHAPAAPTADRRLFFVRDGAAYALDDAGRTSRVAVTEPLESLAVNRAGTTLAAVTRRTAGQQSLLLVDLTGNKPVRTAVTSARITTPTWEPGGAAVWVVQTTAETQQVVVVPSAGPNSYIDLPAVVPSPVTALRVSPDGARAALVAGGSVWLARVERPASGGRVLGEPVRVTPAVRGVTAVAFDGAARLLFAGRSGARPALWRVDVDGFQLETLRDAGLPPAPVTALTVSAGDPADRVASAQGRLWRRTPGGDWAAVRDAGTAGTFAG